MDREQKYKATSNRMWLHPASPAAPDAALYFYVPRKSPAACPFFWAGGGLTHRWLCPAGTRDIVHAQTRSNEYLITCVFCGTSSVATQTELRKLSDAEERHYWWLRRAARPPRGAQSSGMMRAVVEIFGKTYGPHTRHFGLHFDIYTADRSYELSIGGGNNYRPISRVEINLSASFPLVSRAEQVALVEKALRDADSWPGYVRDNPPVRDNLPAPRTLRAIVIPPERRKPAASR